MRTRLGLCILVVGVALAAVACGGDDEGDSSGQAAGGGTPEGPVAVSSWGGSWTEAEQENIGTPFTEETGIDVDYKVTGESPTSPALLQAQSGNVQLDVINSENAELLRSKGLLATWPQEIMDLLEATARPDAYKEDLIAFGNTANVIVCNPNVMEKCPTTAEEFWDVERFPGRRAIMDQAEAALAFALQADGVPKEEVYPLDVDRAIAKLEEIKPEIRVWPSSGDEQQQVLINEEVGAAIMWNGRAWGVKQENIPELEMYWDGAQVSYGSGLVVMKDAPHQEAAFEYIKWILENPEAQATWSEALTYMTPTKQLNDLVDPEVAAALPSAHEDDVIVEDDEWLVENNEAIQGAWQEFLAG
jgi:putative spermidine/putrescine transport system substrate-binding protein